MEFIFQRIDLKDITEASTSNLHGGRYSYVVGPPYPGSVVISVNCGDPLCGVKSVSSATQMDSFRSRDVAFVAERYDEYLNYQDPEERSLSNDGGILSSPQSWPFVAALYRDGIFVCGATIISRRWIATAANCLQDFHRKDAFFQVYLELLSSWSS